MIETYLPEFQAAVDQHRRVFTPMYTIRDGDHETALMRISSNESSWRSRQTMYVLACDCDYKQYVGWHYTSSGEAVHRPKGLITPENCARRNRAVEERRDELKREFSQMEITIPDGVSKSAEQFLTIEHGLIWLSSLLQKGELIGTPSASCLQANNVTVRDAAEIMDVELPNNVAKVAELMRQNGEVMIQGDTIYAPVLEFETPRISVLT